MNDLPSLQDCKETIITCRFTFEAEYAPITTLVIFVVSVFLIAPFLVRSCNILLFHKFLCGTSMIEILCTKRKPLVKIFRSKKERMMLDVKAKDPDNEEEEAFKKAQMMRRDFSGFNIELSKINQIAPILYTEAMEDLLPSHENQDQTIIRESKRKTFFPHSSKPYKDLGTYHTLQIMERATDLNNANPSEKETKKNSHRHNDHNKRAQLSPWAGKKDLS